MHIFTVKIIVRKMPIHILLLSLLRTHLVQINTHMRRTKYLKTHTN